MNDLRGHAVDEMRVLERQLGVINDGLLSETGGGHQYTMIWQGQWKDVDGYVRIDVTFLEDDYEFIIEPWFRSLENEAWEEIY